MTKKFKNIFLGTGFLILVFIIFIVIFWKKSPTNNYITAKVERGDIRTSVTATGTLQATTTVQVGSQVSGTIASLGVDFNSHVTKGQVIATLDPAVFQAQVDSAYAGWQSAQAAEETTRKSYDQELATIKAAQANIQTLIALQKDAHDLVNRNKKLSSTIISSRDIESSIAAANAADARIEQAKAQELQARASAASAKARIDQASAQVKASKAVLDQQKITLSKTIIKSPVDGVVISRNIDIGQTVAASLQAPTLFTIANDLTKMQVLANIDEADVGSIKEGQSANFTVDAFPSEIFTGSITQLRLNSTTTQNVVIYNAVIIFDNPGSKLRPGMTTNVTFPIAESLGVLKVSNVALRFRPSTEAGRKSFPGRSSQNETPQIYNNQKNNFKTLWILDQADKLESRKVEIGITDGKETEIKSGEIKEGDRIVLGVIDANNTRSQQPSNSGGSPFGGGRSPIGGSRGR